MAIFPPFLLFFLLISTIPQFVIATISNNFRTFVQNRFGKNVADLLSRDDLTGFGSFGGGNHEAGQKTKRLPIIFVHGMLTNAGTIRPIASYFKLVGGYTEEELYATTYGPRGSIIWKAAIECQYPQAFLLRYLIMAVNEFTNSQVNVIAYSLGVPTVRKAILGGPCVDDNDVDLGPKPLTHLVNTFVAVAGPSQGVPWCSLPFADFTSTCNPINGLQCGSQFLRNINERLQHYEAQWIGVIRSTGDFTVGTSVCGGIQPTNVPGADYTLTFKGITHLQVCTLTVQQQLNLITKHTS